AGNTPATARNIGTLGATAQSFSDFVGVADDLDYYRFTTSGVSNFDLRLDQLSGPANVRLLASDGVTELAASVNLGTTPETINVSSLAAGTYFVKVNQGGAGFDANYTLTLSAPAASPQIKIGGALVQEAVKHIGEEYFWGISPGQSAYANPSYAGPWD